MDITIYVRKDIRTKDKKKVSNGKMSAQCAHSLMGLFLSMFKEEGAKFILRKENELFLEKFLNNDYNLIFKQSNLEEINKVRNENLSNTILIKDQGRTSFSEPTITTMSLLSSSSIKLKNNIVCDNKEPYKKFKPSKQVIVLNKEEIKDKSEMYDIFCRLSLSFLIEEVKKSNDKRTISLEKESLYNWVKYSFVKIALKPKQKSFDEAIKEVLNKENKNETFIKNFEKDGIIKAFCIGADLVDSVDYFTKEGYSLV